MSAAVRESIERAVAGSLVAGMCLHQACAMAGILERVVSGSTQGGFGGPSAAMRSPVHFCVDISHSRDRLQ
ncbi:hypothetical protein A9P79_05875 [Cupriavidus taiwanensis]|nr:hypothetical protein A9P79_05875 [Cupriavidus taiwanensis]